MSDPDATKSLPRPVSYLVIGLALAGFGTLGVMRACSEAGLPTEAAAALGPWPEVPPLHPHHHDSVCRSFFYPPGQPGFVVQRAFDGRVPKWKAPVGPAYKRSYDFESFDSFGHNIPVWKELLGAYAGKPQISYLEVGVWEGRSALWMLENILTDPSASLTAIDIVATNRWVKNLSLSGRGQNVKMIVAPSQKALRTLSPESFDIIYIDGSHLAADVLADAVFAWELLKPGGIMIFDDYCLDASDFGADGQAFPLDKLPKVAIDAFLLAYNAELELLHRYYQLAVRKRSPLGCEKTEALCVTLQLPGDWVYAWNVPTLRKRGSAETAQLNEVEHRLLQRILRTADVGNLGYRLDHSLASNPALPSLEAKLRVRFVRTEAASAAGPTAPTNP
jgi:SAM-dependent methyltransferase